MQLVTDGITNSKNDFKPSPCWADFALLQISEGTEILLGNKRAKQNRFPKQIKQEKNNSIAGCFACGSRMNVITE